jgi:hypothetical protein
VVELTAAMRAKSLAAGLLLQPGSGAFHVVESFMAMETEETMTGSREASGQGRGEMMC